MSITTMNKSIHEGRNIKRFREMLNMTQEAMAADLGDDWTQKKISLLEGKEKVEPEIINQVAKVLKVPAEAIKNFDEETAIQNIQNNYEGAVIHGGPTVNYKCTINPMDKWLEAMEENKKLYERLLQTEREKVEMLEKQLNEKKK
ncbi:helix-turn-helix transcriptional regulator [Chitinophaga qingshengii]|uniref:Helix-turn-helix transcriptional regulator n=1 Tax=Chitinophaga qingshengii TaxID=1569794 RepID=A0ABR7TFC2_9BACT|nr:helix-turn-helix transcriptional regulator [Chitinophaga qingshengii]MBC9929031.1 helix-turn-helix transcriptional regulator [Chitinophaga qingshengii]